MSGFPVAAPSLLPSATFAGEEEQLYASSGAAQVRSLTLPGDITFTGPNCKINNVREIRSNDTLQLKIDGLPSVSIGITELGTAYVANDALIGLQVDLDTNTTVTTEANGNNAGGRMLISSALSGGDAVISSGAAQNGNLKPTALTLNSPFGDPQQKNVGRATITSVNSIFLTTEEPTANPGSKSAELSLEATGVIRLVNNRAECGIEMSDVGQILLTASGATYNPTAFVNITNAGTINFDNNATSPGVITNVKSINGLLYPPPGITTIADEIIFSVTGGAAQLNIPLQRNFDGLLFAVDTSATGSTSYTINFTGQISATGGSFFIKNVSETDEIRIAYQGVLAEGVNAILYPRSAVTRTNSALCVCFVDPSGVLTVY